jgi:adenosylmethionine-8-amino-7-oxononanoate aminotransferase
MAVCETTCFAFLWSVGVCLRPLGNTLYILPPFVISDDQLQQIYRVIEEALEVFGK